MNATSPAAPSSILVLVALLLAAVALRLPHLGGPIDEPHAWRQAETAQYARSFHEDGIDLLRPSVCWLGPHKTLVEEFPLPEALMALGYRLTGGENLVLARLVTLAFYLGATLYLFLLVRLLFDAAVGALALVVFSVLPLGLFYSRGVHVDPAVLCFVHAAVFHAVRAHEQGRGRDFAAAALWALPACLIKAPYALPFALPIGALMLTRRRPRRAVALVLAAVPAVLGFLAWRYHSAVVNGAVPDWSFIPDATAGPRTSTPVSRQGAIPRAALPVHRRATHRPVMNATSPSTATILRWSRMSHPSGLSNRGGLKQRTSPPAATSGAKRREETRLPPKS